MDQGDLLESENIFFQNNRN